MNLNRKRNKELRQLQNSATALWENQQHLVAEAAGVAREAGRQLGNFNREQVIPTVQHAYESRVAPTVNRSIRASRKFVDNRVVPAVGGVVGTAMSAWDAANERRHALSGVVAPRRVVIEPKKSGPSAGGVIAIILGAVAAVGVLYAAWQTLRADDELWVADDPLTTPEA